MSAALIELPQIHDAVGHAGDGGKRLLRAAGYLSRRILDLIPRRLARPIGSRTKSPRTVLPWLDRRELAAVGGIVTASRNAWFVGVRQSITIGFPRIDDGGPPRGTIQHVQWRYRPLQVSGVFRRGRGSVQSRAEVMQRWLFDEGKNVVDPPARLTPVVSPVGLAGPAKSPAAGWKSPGGVLKAEASQSRAVFRC